MHVAVEHARDALRRARRMRLRRSLRQARAGRCQDREHLGDLEGHAHRHAARRPERRRLVVLRRLPAQAAAPWRGADRAVARRGPAAHPPVYRVHRRLQHLVCRGVLRARDRHHQNAQRRHAGLRSLQERCRRGRARARAHRLLQLRRGLPAQARDRDVRVHQVALSAHLSLHEHERADVYRGIGEAAGALGHRRGDVLDRRRLAGHIRAVPAARQVRCRASKPARDGRREAARATRCSPPQLALHPLQVERQRRGDEPRAQAGHRDRRRSALVGDHGSSRELRTRAGSCRARRTSRPSNTKSGT